MDFLDAAASVSAVINGWPNKAEQARVRPALRGWLVGQALILLDGQPSHAAISALMDIALLQEFTHAEIKESA